MNTKARAIETDKTKLEELITRITKAGKRLDGDIQAAGLGCLHHLDAHGDITLVNRLYLGLPQGVRKSAMTAWLLAFGKLAANTADSKKRVPFVYDKAKTTDLASASNNPWYKFSPDKEPDAVFDVRKALASLIARAGKALDVNDAKLLGKLRALEEQEVE